MVNDLQKAKAKHSNPKAKTLAQDLAHNFSKNMDNDLNVRVAFDSFFLTLTKLNKFIKKGELGAGDAEKAISDFRKIDKVLQVIF